MNGKRWNRAKLGDVIKLEYGKSLPDSRRDGGEYPVFGSNGIVGQHSEALVKGPGIIVGRKGSHGEVRWSDKDFYPIDTTYYVSASDSINMRFAYYLLRSLDLKSLNRSTAIPGLNRNDAYSLEIPLPPLPDQKRIVAKLDTLFGHLDQLRSRLDKIPILLKQFRQAVLTQAVTGKLTEEWRNLQVSNANEDLGTIMALKAKLLAAGSLKGSKLEPIKDGKAILKVIPTNWETCILDDIFRFIDYRGKTPRRTRTGRRLISAKNIKMGYLSERPIEYMSARDYEVWMTRGLPKPGDIFFVTEGHTMGNVALNNRSDEFALAQRILTMQSFSKLQADFFFLFMQTNMFQEIVKQNATGTAAIGIKAAKFKNLTVPFPSLSEQKEIVRRVEDLLNMLRSIETMYQEAQSYISKIPHLILNEAFRGNLADSH